MPSIAYTARSTLQAPAWGDIVGWRALGRLAQRLHGRLICGRFSPSLLLSPPHTQPCPRPSMAPSRTTIMTALLVAALSAGPVLGRGERMGVCVE